MSIIQSINEHWAKLGLTIEQCKNESDVLKVVVVKRLNEDSNIPAVFSKANGAFIAQADDFFISVLLAKATTKEFGNFSKFFEVARTVVDRITQLDAQDYNPSWIGSVHPSVKLTQLYKQLLHADPFVYSKGLNDTLVSIGSDYSSTMSRAQTTEFLEAALGANALDLATCAMEYNAKCHSADACRSFFAHLLQHMPAHFFKERRNEVIEIAKMLAAENNLQVMPIDTRNPTLSIHSFVLRCANGEQNAAQACVLLFNEQNFTSIFDSFADNVQVEDDHLSQQAIY